MIDQNDPRIGPLVSAGGKWWTFLGRERDGNRDLVELIPKPDRSRRRRSPPRADRWLPALKPSLLEPMNEHFAPWTLLSAAVSKETGFKADFHGERTS